MPTVNVDEMFDIDVTEIVLDSERETAGEGVSVSNKVVTDWVACGGTWHCY